jgi:hypothetical protein
MTWPQVLHAMGVETSGSESDLAERQTAKQDEIFACIAARRGYLPGDLWRLPVQELADLVCAEADGARPAMGQLLDGLRRFAAIMAK